MMAKIVMGRSKDFIDYKEFVPFIKSQDSYNFYYPDFGYRSSDSNEETPLQRAIEIANSDIIVGYTADIIRNAANNNIDTFTEFLSNIADQASDQGSVSATIRTYGQELVDIALQLNNKTLSFHCTYCLEIQIRISSFPLLDQDPPSIYHVGVFFDVLSLLPL